MDDVLITAAHAMSPELARGIHRIQQLAYAQEARLLGAVDFPPLRVQPADIAAGSERFWIGRRGPEIVAAAGVDADDEQPAMLRLASLVVDPAVQRRGIGHRLLAAVLAGVPPGRPIAVHTGALNAPALALYARHGFVEQRRWVVGRERLELVRLLRR